jgi:hypothetical protein
MINEFNWFVDENIKSFKGKPFKPTQWQKNYFLRQKVDSKMGKTTGKLIHAIYLMKAEGDVIYVGGSHETCMLYKDLFVKIVTENLQRLSTEITIQQDSVKVFGRWIMFVSKKTWNDMKPKYGLSRVIFDD